MDLAEKRKKCDVSNTSTGEYRLCMKSIDQQPESNVQLYSQSHYFNSQNKH